MINYSSIGQEIRMQFPIQQMGNRDKINLFLALGRELDAWRCIAEADQQVICDTINQLWDK